MIGEKDESRVAKAAASQVHRVTTVDDKKENTTVEREIKKKKEEKFILEGKGTFFFLLRITIKKKKKKTKKDQVARETERGRKKELKKSPSGKSPDGFSLTIRSILSLIESRIHRW